MGWERPKETCCIVCSEAGVIEPISNLQEDRKRTLVQQYYKKLRLRGGGRHTNRGDAAEKYVSYVIQPNYIYETTTLRNLPKFEKDNKDYNPELRREYIHIKCLRKTIKTRVDNLTWDGTVRSIRQALVGEVLNRTRPLKKRAADVIKQAQEARLRAETGAIKWPHPDFDCASIYKCACGCPTQDRKERCPKMTCKTCGYITCAACKIGCKTGAIYSHHMETSLTHEKNQRARALAFTKENGI